MQFDDIVAGHVEWLARLAFRFYPRKDDAADLAQDTLVRILSNRDKFNDNMDFKPWAYTVMSNLFKTRKSRDGLIPFVSFGELDIAHDGRADDETICNDTLRLIERQAKRRKGIDCVLLYAQGYDYDEIARMLNISTGTVKSRIFYGRKVIAKALQHNVN